MECKISDWECAYHACEGNNCQFNMLTNKGTTISYGIPDCGLGQKAQRIAAVWDNFDRIFIRKNFPVMSWPQLLIAVNEIRHVNTKVTLSQLRHEVRRLGLYKGRQIRWSSIAIKYLKDNYQTQGNIELAAYLSIHHSSYRKIEGEKIFRVFNKKNIEKKMVLLGLKRTPEQLITIKEKHVKNGAFKGAWVGKRKPAEEENIRIRTMNGVKKRVIKINGRYIHYRRWLYKNFIAPIPDGYMVYGKDGDTLNDDPDNLGICKRKGLHSTEQLEEAIILLNGRKRKLTADIANLHRGTNDKGKLRITYEDLKEKEKKINAELNRVDRISKEFEQKLEKRCKNIIKREKIYV